MSTPTEAFEAFRAAFERGEQPNPIDYLETVTGRDRLALDTMIDRYLTEDAPLRSFDPQAFAAAQETPLMQRIASVVADAPLAWPSLLPALRQQAGLRRVDLAEQLARDLDLAGHEPLVAAAYHEMEAGQLTSRTVKEPVLQALSRLLDTTIEGLRRAGEAVTPRPAAAAGYARGAAGDEALYRNALDALGDAEAQQRVDELFRATAE